MWFGLGITDGGKKDLALMLSLSCALVGTRVELYVTHGVKLND